MRKHPERLHDDFGRSAIPDLRDRYDVQLVRLGGNLFADLHFSNRAHGDTNVDMPFGLIATHMVVKLTVTKDDLGLGDDGRRRVEEHFEDGCAG